MPDSRTAAHQPPGAGDLASYRAGRYELAGWVAADPERSGAAVLLRVHHEQIRPAGSSAAWSAVRGDGIWLTILGDPGADPSAVLVSWQSFRALLPLVKPARLPAQTGPVSLLIIPDRLLKESPPRSGRAASSRLRSW